jgi:hypothetical protein
VLESILLDHEDDFYPAEVLRLRRKIDRERLKRFDDYRLLMKGKKSIFLKLKSL